MPLGLKNSILNQKGTPAFYSDTFANRPTYGFAGRVFISTDTAAIYEDTGTSWVLISNAGSGTTPTLQLVTATGNTTNQGISVTAGGLSANTVSVIGGTSSQFLKANGSLDSTTYIGLTSLSASSPLSYNSGTGAFTIQVANTSQSGYLSNTDWNTFNNKAGLTSLSASSPLSYNSGTGAFSITQSGGFANGYLSSTDWTTFNNKQSTITNPITGTGTSGYVSKFNGTGSITNSTIQDNGTTVTFNVSSVFTNGIKTTGTADQQLFVYGSSPSLRLYNTLTSPTITGFVGMSTGVNNFIQGSASGDMCIGTSTAGKLFLGTGTTTVSPQITITSTNFVGINKISPNTALDVTGAGTFSIKVITPKINFQQVPYEIYVENTDSYLRLTSEFGFQLECDSGGAGVNYYRFEGTDSASGSGFQPSNSAVWAVVSDERIKTNIRPINNSLEKLLSLNPKHYEYIDKVGKIKTGFIAQDFEKVFPGHITEQKTPQNLKEFTDIRTIKSIDADLLPYIVKAIQELNDKLVRNNIN